MMTKPNLLTLTTTSKRYYSYLNSEKDKCLIYDENGNQILWIKYDLNTKGVIIPFYNWDMGIDKDCDHITSAVFPEFYESIRDPSPEQKVQFNDLCREFTKDKINLQLQILNELQLTKFLRIETKSEDKGIILAVCKGKQIISSYNKHGEIAFSLENDAESIKEIRELNQSDLMQFTNEMGSSSPCKLYSKDLHPGTKCLTVHDQVKFLELPYLDQCKLDPTNEAHLQYWADKVKFGGGVLYTHQVTGHQYRIPHSIEKALDRVVKERERISQAVMDKTDPFADFEFNAFKRELETALSNSSGSLSSTLRLSWFFRSETVCQLRDAAQQNTLLSFRP